MFPMSLLDGVEGWFDEQECQIWYEIVRQAAFSVAEIGSWQGRSAIVGACAIKGSDRQVFCIDFFDVDDPAVYGDAFKIPGRTPVSNLQVFKSNLQNRGLLQQVVIQKGDSKTIGENWNAPLGAVLVDGDHSYLGCFTDMVLFSKHLVSGGRMMVDDYTHHFRGVMVAVDAFLSTFPDWLIEKRTQQSVVLSKE